VRSDDINEYVKDVTSRDFSAKDFRTWNATVLAAVAVAADPRVFDRLRSGWTIADALAEVGEPDLGDPRKRARLEAAVLDLLEGE
jgi:hypothetical protein